MPTDLADMDFESLQKVADSARQKILKVVSENGGHLSSNLGVVELTVALYHVFDPSENRVIWDVGHQCYTHKLLTGRQDRFESLRQEGGISGFPRLEESQHDHFGTGHSSTSLSAALGMACAARLKGSKEKSIAVIGDGSMTAGLAFEAMNHAGQIGPNMLIVLNDNEMSISKNVGALSRYLNRLITARIYNVFKRDVGTLVKRVPRVGPRIVRIIRRFQESIKALMVRSVIFEELGFRYIGPIDGHDIPRLVKAFSAVRDYDGPALVHVVTKKGKGYKPAEKDPTWFHSAPSFDIATGKAKAGKNPGVQSFTQKFGDTVAHLAENDSAVIAITAGMTDGTGLLRFAREFPDRFFDVGIAEQHAAVFSAALAQSGYKPVVAVYSTFLQRSVDQLIHDVALQNQPVVFALDRAGIVGPDGPTHNGVFDIALTRAIPNMVVAAPSDGAELAAMLHAGLNAKSPWAIRYPKASAYDLPDVPDRENGIVSGRALVRREGNDIVFLALGPMVRAALKAAEILKTGGIDAGVIDARFVKPLDTACIEDLLKRHSCIITVEDHVLKGGFGSAVLEAVERMAPLKTCVIHRLGLPDRFHAQGTRDAILKSFGLDSSGLADAAKRILSGCLES